MVELNWISHIHQCHWNYFLKKSQSLWNLLTAFSADYQSNRDIVVSIVYFMGMFLVLPMWLMAWVLCYSNILLYSSHWGIMLLYSVCLYVKIVLLGLTFWMSKESAVIFVSSLLTQHDMVSLINQLQLISWFYALLSWKWFRDMDNIQLYIYTGVTVNVSSNLQFRNVCETCHFLISNTVIVW